MNSATIKYSKRSGCYGSRKFQGCITAVQKYIVAYSYKQKRKSLSSINKDRDNTSIKRDHAPVINHYKDSNEDKFKVRDSKDCNSKTIHSYNCPFHLNRLEILKLR